MAKFIKGDVVVVPFPFSDLTEAKRRPALVIADLEGDDVILCQITSRWVKDKYVILIDNEDFVIGNLGQKSHIRPNRIFTADRRIILYRIGRLRPEKVKAVIQAVTDIFKE